ncbi:Signal transduction histidine kinase [Anaerosporobacter mobilis DSM 15930]|uniref:histidine kinase n=1 Tax=Anaerosporobacter mobilis DSM 15930 TaxID=1120996 RepID=A0A1M7M9S0_9FIRM|nr:HAMP domain-containing sensor histidine kinase [Anaerosporobacter mobilis]SHM87512.1 Signal transduction histidine kinase [Anaerosporobacter mobilis DSM 15930]
MRSKIVEWIRKLLIRTVLPLRKRMGLFFSQFYFSIAFRISLNYLRLLIINSVVFCFLFVGVYLGISAFDNNTLEKQMILKLENEEISIADLEDRNPYYSEGLSLRITNEATKEVVFNDTLYNIEKRNSIFNRVFYGDIDGKKILVVKDKQKVKIGDSNYTLYFQFDLSSERLLLSRLVPFVILLLAIFTGSVIVYGKKGDEKLFLPLKDMSRLANRLTVNNLQSERINLAGTKNELKDLAVTINQMLDRIELSYESQKQFVSDASHELRTPIAVIQGYVNMLDRWGKSDTEVLEESIEAIKNESKAMQELVEKLLFLSRHDKKTLRLEKHVFNMRVLVEDMLKETKMVTTNRIVETKALEDVMVYGDKQALKQAIRVFVDNAVKYTSDGDSIYISCENKEGDCVISVEDTGIGMTKRDIDNIFERFYRSDHVRDRKISGHGLGLSIAKLIIMKHTGNIRVRSQYTKGSSFIVTIPKRR